MHGPSYIEKCIQLPLPNSTSFNQDTMLGPSYIEKCIQLPLPNGTSFNQDTTFCIQCALSQVHREVYKATPEMRTSYNIINWDTLKLSRGAFVCMHTTLPCQLINIPLPVAMALDHVNIGRYT